MLSTKQFGWKAKLKEDTPFGTDMLSSDAFVIYMDDKNEE